MLKALGADKKALIVTADVEPMVVRASNNIQGVKTTFVGSLNVVDILNCDKMIVSQDAVEACRGGLRRMKSPYDIIKKPVLTERSYDAMADKKYTFEVAIGANKTEIKYAVETCSRA